MGKSHGYAWKRQERSEQGGHTAGVGGAASGSGLYGLTAPAAGVPLKPRVEDDFYLDPLGLRPGDSRTDLGRSQIPVEFRFSNPKSIPGQTHSNNYVIRPPENRTYDALNINMNER